MSECLSYHVEIIFNASKGEKFHEGEDEAIRGGQANILSCFIFIRIFPVGSFLKLKTPFQLFVFGGEKQHHRNCIALCHLHEVGHLALSVVEASIFKVQFAYAVVNLFLFMQ